MEFILTFESFRSGERDYFIKIIDKLFPGLSKEDINQNKEEIINKMIDRARYNLDSRATPEKEKYWRTIITELLDTFVRKGSFKSDEEEHHVKDTTIKDYNLKIMNSSPKAREEMNELPEYILKEVGYDVIVKFLEKEDGMNFQNLIPRGMELGGSVDFSKKGDNGDDIRSILNRPENRASWGLVSDKLRSYYAKRVFANIPTDRRFASIQEAERFLRVYTEKFIYGYLLPMSGKVTE